MINQYVGVGHLLSRWYNSKYHRAVNEPPFANFLALPFWCFFGHIFWWGFQAHFTLNLLQTNSSWSISYIWNAFCPTSKIENWWSQMNLFIWKWLNTQLKSISSEKKMTKNLVMNSIFPSIFNIFIIWKWRKRPGCSYTTSSSNLCLSRFVHPDLGIGGAESSTQDFMPLKNTPRGCYGYCGWATPTGAKAELRRLVVDAALALQQQGHEVRTQLAVCNFSRSKAVWD